MTTSIDSELLSLTIRTLTGDLISIQIPRHTLWPTREILDELYKVDARFHFHFTTIHYLNPETFEPLRRPLPLTEDSLITAMVSVPDIYIKRIVQPSVIMGVENNETKRQVYHVKVYCPQEYAVDSYDIVQHANGFWVVPVPDPYAWFKDTDEDTIPYATTLEEAVEHSVPELFREPLLRTFHAGEIMGEFERFPYEEYDNDDDWDM